MKHIIIHYTLVRLTLVHNIPVATLNTLICLLFIDLLVMAKNILSNPDQPIIYFPNFNFIKISTQVLNIQLHRLTSLSTMCYPNVNQSHHVIVQIFTVHKSIS